MGSYLRVGGHKPGTLIVSPKLSTLSPKPQNPEPPNPKPKALYAWVQEAAETAMAAAKAYREQGNLEGCLGLGLGFRIWVLGIGVSGLGFRVWSLGLVCRDIQGLGHVCGFYGGSIKRGP